MYGCRNPQCVDVEEPENGPHDGCNWLDWMVFDTTEDRTWNPHADGSCPHCGGPLVHLENIAPAGRLMDSLG